VDFAMTVSILLPLYNSEKFIVEAIDSVLHQTFQDFELLVIDDGSTDRSAEIVSDYADKRIKLYRRDHFGLIDSLNFGLSEAKGELIARFVSIADKFLSRISGMEEYAVT
jgi:glycosyltransferase involved in cell wall biosynthesis